MPLAVAGVIGSLVTPALYESEVVHFANIYISGLLKAASKLRYLEIMNKNFSMASFWEERVQATPNNTAIIFEDKTYSYSEVNKEANKLAWFFKSLGLKKGEVVALMMENRPEFMFIWIALAKIGVVTAFINYKLSGISLVNVIKVAKASFIIVGSELLSHFATVHTSDNKIISSVYVYKGINGVELPSPFAIQSIHGIDMDNKMKEFKDKITNTPAEWRYPCSMTDPLWYIYTSGTSGLPKASVVIHRNVFNRSNVLKIFMETVSTDRIYVAIPLYHSSGSVISLQAWHVGASIVLRRSFSVKEFWNDCRKYQVSIFIYIGEVCRYLLLQPELPNDSIHNVRIIIGNGMRTDVWSKFQARFKIPKIIEFYGSTEGTSTINLTNKVGAVGYTPYPFDKISKNKLVKYDVDKEEYIRNNKGFLIECDIDEPGELISKMEDRFGGLSTGGSFVGYTDKSATEKKIIKDVFEKGDAWFRTGDLLKKDKEGYTYFVDRIGDTFRWKGENVSTTEVAELLSTFPSVEEATVYGVKVPNYEGRVGMASIVVENIASFPWEQLSLFLSKNLPSYARPQFIRVQKEIEKTSTFKHTKVQLMKDGFDPSIIKDPIFVRREHNSYEPLTVDIHQNIINGALKL